MTIAENDDDKFDSGGYFSGISRQGAPVRNTQRIPSKTSLLPRQGLPCLPDGSSGEQRFNDFPFFIAEFHSNHLLTFRFFQKFNRNDNFLKVLISSIHYL